MAFDTPFKLLSQQEVERLALADGTAARAAFIDCLALLHDILASFGSEPQNPVLVKYDHRNKEFRFARADKMLRECIEGVGGFDTTCRNALSENFDTASSLRDEFTASTRQVTSYEARQLVDEYLNQLINQYLRLRYPTAVLP
jgi:hypothetical protein